jgi:ParB family chromosome partitioning protein
MARGTRTSLADLSGAVGDNSPVDAPTPKTTTGSLTAPLSDLMPNPRNPRDDLGDLENLASIADMQLQPVLVVTKSAYRKLYPDDAITTRYIVINGCRRLAAAHKYGRTDLAIVVNDEVARDRVTLISAAISENVDRQDFDVIEEAKAVQALVDECGRADEAAKRLRKTEGWVSQRRALLALAPELQTALRRGELAIRDARALARVPHEKQVASWRLAQERGATSDKNKEPGHSRPPAKSRVLATALTKFESEPNLLADALQTYLGADGVQRLIPLLTAVPQREPGR